MNHQHFQRKNGDKFSPAATARASQAVDSFSPPSRPAGYSSTIYSQPRSDRSQIRYTRRCDPRELERDMSELTNSHEGIMKSVFELVRLEVLVVDAKGILRNNISSICIPDFVDGKNFTCFLISIQSVADVFDLLANEILELSNRSFREPTMNWISQKAISDKTSPLNALRKSCGQLTLD